MTEIAETELSPDRPARLAKWLPLLLILAATLVVFGPIIKHQFLAWDDDFTLEFNPRMRQPSVANTVYYWRHAFMDLYVPVTYTVWSGLAFLAKAIGRPAPDGAPDPRFFHAASVLVHALNAALVYWLLRRLLKTRWPAAGGAMLFALHPIQVEAVAWASGFKDLLCATFSLIALLQYVLAVQPAEPGEPERSTARRRAHYAIAMAAMLLGTLSKPGAIVVAPLILVVDLLMLRRPWRRVLIASAPFFLLAVPCIVWTRLCQPSDYLRYVPLWQRPIVAADALAFYLSKLLVPARQAFDYSRAPWVIFEHHYAWFTWILPVTLAMALFVYRRSVTTLIAAALLMVIGVAPVLGLNGFDFEMISTVADHYFYLAMLGPALAAAWALDRWATQVGSASRRPVVACVAILGLLAARTVVQSRHWQDSREFFSHTLAVNPSSWSSWFGLGYVNHTEGRQLMLKAMAEAKAGMDPTVDQLEAKALMADAMECYRRTISLSDSNLAAHHGYGAMLMFFGRYKEAADQFHEVVVRREHLRPIVRAKYYEDTDLLGQCLMAFGRPADAVRAFRAATLLDPPPANAAAHLRAAETSLAQQREKNAQQPSSGLADTHAEAAESPTDGD
ncbi:MAG TPA: hypothetical protein VGI81_23300 [Tepidisphaeraceae bacterium]|jgi:tetratricopeptide (TPR) repeat protein